MKRTLIALSIIALSGAAIAQEGVDFTQVDADANGTVSFTEIQAVMPDLTTEAFVTADADGSSELSIEEFTALAEMGMAN